MSGILGAIIITVLLSIGGAVIAGLFGAIIGVAIGVIVELLTIGNAIVCLTGGLIGGALRRD